MAGGGWESATRRLDPRAVQPRGTLVLWRQRAVRRVVARQQRRKLPVRVRLVAVKPPVFGPRFIAVCTEGRRVDVVFGSEHAVPVLDERLAIARRVELLVEVLHE